MKIKENPGDFLVEEVNTIRPSKEGEYVYFQLKKENWTTGRAIKQIARKLRVSKKRVGYAGNKDKHAITKQICSAWKVSVDELERIRLKDIEIKVLGKGNHRINLGDLEGNLFKIKIREVSDSELAKFEKNFKKIGERGFLNLFGEQRFGSAGNTDRIGAEIIKGDLEGAAREFITENGDNEEAAKFGTFAKKDWGNWKEILKECPKFLGLEKAVLNWLVRVPTDFGGALRQVPKRIRRIFISAYQSRVWNKKVRKMAESGDLPEFLEIPPIKVERMPELNMRGAKRKIVIKPKRLKYKREKEFIELEFELEKGVYATELIRQLFI